MIDRDTVQLLGDLPADLVARGWAFLESESGRVKSAPRYRAVHSRPYDDHRDHQPVIGAVYDKWTRQRILRVATYQDRSPNREAAREDAIRRMREADAKRRRRG